MLLIEIFNKIIDKLTAKLKVSVNTDNILIIRTDGIGDFFIFINSLIKIKEKYPKKIGIVGNKEVIDYILEKNICDFGIEFNERKYKYNIFYRIFKNIELLDKNYSKVINPIYSRTNIIDNLVHLIRAPIKIGVKGCFANQRVEDQESLNYVYTSLFTADSACINEFDKNNRFLEFLEVEVDIVKRLKLKNCQKLNKIIIGPCTGRRYRQWGEDKYIQLIKNISSVKNLEIILVGSQADKNTCKRIIQNVGSILSINDLTGRLSLSQLEVLIRNSDLVISGETSLTHIAAYVGTQAVCIAGGGHFGRFVPYSERHIQNQIMPIIVNEAMSCYGCNWNCTVKPNDELSPMPCIEQISILKVSNLILGLMDEGAYD